MVTAEQPIGSRCVGWSGRCPQRAHRPPARI